MNTYRFAILVGVKADNLEDAYAKLAIKMSLMSGDTFDWESSNEAYTSNGPEGSPAQIPEETMEAARQKVTKELNS